MHDRHEHGVRGECGVEVGRVDQPFGVHRQVGDAEAVQPGQAVAGGEDGGVFGGLGDDVVAAVAVGQGGAADGQGVGLGAAAGEHDLLGRGVDEFGDGGPCRGDGGVGGAAVGVVAGGVAEVLGQVRQARLGHPGVDGCGGVVVQVDRAFAESTRDGHGVSLAG